MTTDQEILNSANPAELQPEVDPAAGLKADIDELSKKLGTDEIGIEEFQKQSNDILIKHTFFDFINVFNNTYEELCLYADNPEKFAKLNTATSNSGSKGLTGKQRRKRSRGAAIKTEAALRRIMHTRDSFELKDLAELYKSSNLVALRDDKAAIAEAKQAVAKILSASNSRAIDIDAIKYVKYAGTDILSTLSDHLCLALYAMIKKVGTFDMTPAVIQLAKNCNMIRATLMSSGIFDKADIAKAKWTAYDTFCKAVQEFDKTVKDEIIDREI